MVHVLGRCVSWSEERRVFLQAAAATHTERHEAIAVQVLTARPGAAGFVEAVAFASAVDRGDAEYWEGSA